MVKHYLLISETQENSGDSQPQMQPITHLSLSGGDLVRNPTRSIASTRLRSAPTRPSGSRPTTPPSARTTYAGQLRKTHGTFWCRGKGGGETGERERREKGGEKERGKGGGGEERDGKGEGTGEGREESRGEEECMVRRIALPDLLLHNDW